MINAFLGAVIVISVSLYSMERRGNDLTRRELAVNKQERLNEIKKRPNVVALMKREEFSFSDVQNILDDDCHFVLTFNFIIAGYWKAYEGFNREISLEHILFGALRELLATD